MDLRSRADSPADVVTTEAKSAIIIYYEGIYLENICQGS